MLNGGCLGKPFTNYLQFNIIKTGCFNNPLNIGMNCLWRDQPFSSINSMTSYIFMSLINRPCFPKWILVHCGTAKIDLGSRILVHFGKTIPPKFYYGTWRLMISRRHMSSFLFCSISSNIPSFRCFFHDRQLLNVSRFSFFFFRGGFLCVIHWIRWVFCCPKPQKYRSQSTLAPPIGTSVHQGFWTKSVVASFWDLSAS